MKNFKVLDLDGPVVESKSSIGTEMAAKLLNSPLPTCGTKAEEDWGEAIVACLGEAR